MKHLALLAMACCIQNAVALVPDVAWEAVFGISQQEGGGNVVAANGDAVIAGLDTATNCTAIIKVSAADGNQLWRTNVCTSNVRAGELALDSQGNVVMGGKVTTTTAGDKGRLAKYSGANGTLLWERVEDDTFEATFLSIDADGNIAATFRGSDLLAKVRKFSGTSTRLWSAPAGVQATRPVFGAQGDVFVPYQVGDDFNSTWTVSRLAAADGAVRWTRTTDRINDFAGVLAVDAAGDVAVTGLSTWGPNVYRIKTIKYAGSDGTVRWVAEEEPEHARDGGRAIAIAANGDVLVTARFNANLFTVRYRGTDGTKVWSATYDGATNGEDRGNRVMLDAAGDVYVAATVNIAGGGTGASDIRTFKHSGANGAQLWSYGVSSPNGPSMDFGLHAIPIADGVIVIGMYDLFSGMYVARYGTQPRDPPNAAGLWYNAPAESERGWGLNMTHQGEIIFLTWFTYDDDGTPAWFVMPRAMNQERNTYVGRVYRTTGPPFNSVPFNPAQVAATDVGNGMIRILGPTSAVFNFSSADATSFVNKTLTRQVFGPLPTCSMLPGTGAANFQDLWYAFPAESESGWGMNIAQQGDTMFLTWFTYGAGNKQMWFVGPDTRRTTGNTFTGKLYRTTGPSYRAVPWNPSQVAAFEVGTVTLNFTAFERGSFTYSVDGVSQTKSIVRQNYGVPSTVCR